MENENISRNPPLSNILFEIEVQPWLESLCESLIRRDRLLLRWAGVGLLLNRKLRTDKPDGADLVSKRITTWLKLVPESVLNEVEAAAVDEAHLQAARAEVLDLSSSTELMVAAYSREVLEAIFALLVRAERHEALECVLITIDETMSTRLQPKHEGVGWKSDLLLSARDSRDYHEWWPTLGAPRRRPYAISRP